MRVYVDSSAAVKRAIAEDESDAVERVLREYTEDGDALVTTSLAWVEVSRALRRCGADRDLVGRAMEQALSGIADRPVTADVISLARRIEPVELRSLDAIHLATAILLDVDVVVGYDQRLTQAAMGAGFTVVAPG